MEITPPELEKYLTRDETVEQEFKLSNCKVWATNKRIFVKTSRRIQDFSYNHISSIGFERKVRYDLIAIGMALFIAGILVFNQEEITVIAMMLCLLGVICVILGVYLRREWLELIVVGYNRPVRFKGLRQDLDQLFRIIRRL